MFKNSKLTKSIAVVAVASMFLAACADEDGDDTETEDTTEESTEETTDEAMDDEAMDDEAMDDEAMDDEVALGATGPGCASVPTDGEGSFAGMADDPAATAASNNPLLSTLVTAVTEADLVDTLNSDGPFTIFAPTNDAFAAVDGLDDIIADTDLLTSILTYHVVAGDSLSAADLVEAGSAETVNGAELEFTADGEAVSVNGSAVTICQDVPTANATVHIIDAVLVPAG